jgi:hypothetical protein
MACLIFACLKQVLKRFVNSSMRRNLVLFTICLISTIIATAQETLPKFSASLKKNGKIIISWRNHYPVTTQISIQRSGDSTRNFTTLLTVPDASVAENGFVDAKSPNTHMFYRLFIVLDSGKYLFTKSKRASPDTVISKEKNIESSDTGLLRSEISRLTYLQRNKDSLSITGPDKINAAPSITLNKIFFIVKQDTLIGQLFENAVRKFRDSMLTKTKDTLVFKANDTILIKPFVPKEVYKVSVYVFTNKDGNIMISVPDADKKKYSVRFLNMDTTELFELREIRQSPLIVDKTNFVHSGWFRFELYEGGKLKEKNKFFIPKEF